MELLMLLLWKRCGFVTITHVLFLCSNFHTGYLKEATAVDTGLRYFRQLERVSRWPAPYRWRSGSRDVCSLDVAP